jgi:diguanylate cyclase (GGDEF)-like protein
LQRYVLDAQRQSLLEAADLLLLDDKGMVMAVAGKLEGLPKAGSSVADTPIFTRAQSGGAGEITGSRGQRHVWAVADLPAMRAAGLHVMLGQSHQVLAAASAARLRQGLQRLGGAGLLLFACVWSLAEWGIRRQIVRITSMVNDLGAGNLNARIAQPHPRGELGDLMAVLNSTADSLQQQRTAIDELNQRLQEAHRREISERSTSEERLTRMANYDGLTGLPNRTLFRDRLQRAIKRSRRSLRPLALMFLDIDRFKHINDSLGHEVGDQLLVEVSKVLTACLRGSDSIARDGPPAQAEEVFRLGGDEFMILAEDVAGTEVVADIARRILSVLARQFNVGEHELFISASIGITMLCDANVDLDGLVKQADMAMYRSKELGRDTYCFFDDKMNQAASERHRLEVCLRHALERGEFQLHYQPKADMQTGRVTGVEALLRWKPEGEPMVGPDRFITVLEETGLIVPVGAWVFSQACGQVMKWQRAGMRPLQLAVNVSARQFHHHDLVAQIADVLDETGFDPARLEIELTESMLIDDSESVVCTMTELGKMGVSIAIDDFGTGQSSLRYLKRFNVDTLKIDRSFVKDTPTDPEDSAIAKAVIALGHGLGLKVVAEGVETNEQLDFLRAQGCDQLQGYLLSRPLGADAFAAWLDWHDTPLQVVAA